MLNDLGTFSAAFEPKFGDEEKVFGLTGARGVGEGCATLFGLATSSHTFDSHPSGETESAC